MVPLLLLVRRTLIVTALLLHYRRLLHRTSPHRSHLSSQRILVRIRDLVLGRLLVSCEHRHIFNLELYAKSESSRPRKKHTYRDRSTGLCSNNSIADQVYLPRKQSNIRGCLELDLVTPVVPRSRQVGTGHISDLDGRNDDPVRFIIRKNEPPSRLAEL